MPNLVSIAVTPANPSVHVGSSIQFTATGTYDDSSTQNLTTTATWASSATAKLTIGASTGLAQGVATGSSNVTAVQNSISSNPLAVTVTAAPSQAATTYFLAAPPQGNVGTNLEVGISIGNNTLAGPVVFVPNDNGAGGTFSPNNATLTTAVPSFEFLYTPARTGIVTISTTNGGALTDPAPITVEVFNDNASSFLCITSYDNNNDPIYEQVTMQLVYANCPKLNQSCSSTSNAYLPAITVCNQHLYTS